MAGIGFTLKKLFEKETILEKAKAYIFSGIVAAGPWITSVITINILIIFSRVYFTSLFEMDLFMGSIVYAFVFSQIITSPFQLLITRYISDRLYSKEYPIIRASYNGILNIIIVLTVTLGSLYYYGKEIPIYFKYMAIMLFMFISLIWITMVYLSSIKSYAIISYAYFIGGFTTLILSIFTTYGFNLKFLELLYKNFGIKISQNLLIRLPFVEFSEASSLLFSYLIGIIITFSILFFSFVNTFKISDYRKYDFIRYLDFYPSLFFSGLFYTLGLWVDDILMWYSNFGKNILDVYKYAPIYDNAVFLAYLTVIPTMIMFMVSVETEFYSNYRKYFKLASDKGTYKEIIIAKKEMIQSIYRLLLYTFETQTFITIFIIVISKYVFIYLNFPLIMVGIFRICALGALCNIFILLIYLVLLYFESRKEVLFITITFMSLTAIFTILVLPYGENFYGMGYFLGSFITLIIASVFLFKFLKNIDYNTFARQPIFYKEKEGTFINIANYLNNITLKTNGQ